MTAPPVWALDEDRLPAEWSGPCDVLSEYAPVRRDEALVAGELPEIEVAVEVRLAASPFQPNAYLPCKPIPAGGRVRVLGMESNGALLLVLHENTLGWIPAMFSKTGVGTLKLTVVTQPPVDECATYLGAALSPQDVWQSNVSGPIIVQGLLYRPAVRPGSPHISIAAEIDGGGWVSASQIDRISPGGSGEIIPFTFTLKDVKPDSQVGFRVTGDDEPLAFQAAFYRNDCTKSTPSTPPSAPTPTPTSTTIVHETGPTPGPSSTAKPTPTPSPTSCGAPDGLFGRLWSRYSDRLGCPLVGWRSDRRFPAYTFGEAPFQHGHMFFFKGDQDEVYVTYGDVGEGWTGSGRWEVHVTNWREGDPDYPCAMERPYPEQPVGSFGEVWCNYHSVRQGLGWETNRMRDQDRESPGADVYRLQKFEGGFIFRDSDGWTHDMAYVFFDDGEFVRASYQ